MGTLKIPEGDVTMMEVRELSIMEALEDEAQQVLLAELGPPPAADVLLTGAQMAQIDRYLAKVKDLKDNIRIVEEIGSFRKTDIDLWVDSQRAPMLRQIFWLEQNLLAIAQTARFPGGKQSLSLPGGTIGTRAQQPKLVITDPDKALKFSKKNGIPFKEVIEPYVSRLAEWWKSTGKVPPGCEVEPAGEPKPYVKVQ